jgi:hypothetical protein
MQNFNFFQWIREGVKHSVLQGVSDAVETIGAPDDTAKLHPTIAALTQNQTNASPRIAVNKKQADTTARKRLGRSLKDIDSPA